MLTSVLRTGRNNIGFNQDFRSEPVHDHTNTVCHVQNRSDPHDHLVLRQPRLMNGSKEEYMLTSYFWVLLVEEVRAL